MRQFIGEMVWWRRVQHRRGGRRGMRGGQAQAEDEAGPCCLSAAAGRPVPPARSLERLRARHRRCGAEVAAGSNASLPASACTSTRFLSQSSATSSRAKHHRAMPFSRLATRVSPQNHKTRACVGFPLLAKRSRRGVEAMTAPTHAALSLGGAADRCEQRSRSRFGADISTLASKGGGGGCG